MAQASYSRRVPGRRSGGAHCGRSSDGESSPPSPTVGRNLYDLLTVLVALSFLLAVTVFLARHYGRDAAKAGTILGILVPAVGAVFGVTIAYQAGTAKGHAKGEQAGRASGNEQAKNEVKQVLGPRLQELDEHFNSMVSTIHREGESP